MEIFSDDSDYTSDRSNLNNSFLSMSQSNTNDNSSPVISTKKPLAFVQPVIRNSPISQRNNNSNSFSHVNQSKTSPMNKRIHFDDHQK